MHSVNGAVTVIPCDVGRGGGGGEKKNVLLRRVKRQGGRRLENSKRGVHISQPMSNTLLAYAKVNKKNSASDQIEFPAGPVEIISPNCVALPRNSVFLLPREPAPAPASHHHHYRHHRLSIFLVPVFPTDRANLR